MIYTTTTLTSTAYLVTLVERKSRFALGSSGYSVKLSRKLKTKQEVGDAMIELLSTVSARITLTLDNGGEFADPARASPAAKVAIFFCQTLCQLTMRNE